MEELSIINILRNSLDPHRFKHSLRVRDMVVRLADKYHADPKKASIAGLLHDCSRFMSGKDFIKYAKKIGLKIDTMSIREPKLLHAGISAHIARNKYGIKDKAILQAISSHTLGRSGMSILEKIIYVADHIEEGRTHAAARTARKAAQKDINKAIVVISSSMIEYLLKKELPIHPITYEVRNYYIMNKNE